MKRRIPLSFIFVMTAFVLRAQSGDMERYPDIDLYYRWQETESRDSVYLRAHREYLAETGAEALPSDNTATVPAALSAAFTEAFWSEKDYDKAFHIGLQLEEKLSEMTEAEYPYKREAYYKLGEAYYLFLDFHKSLDLLANALSPSPASFADRTNLDALNIMGICYANIGRMDTSDEYFRATLTSKDIVLDRPIYNAYALSHLGCNAMLTGRYDKALALSGAVWAVLREQTEDYGHLAGMCYCRGRSYLEKGDFKQASTWIDSLVHFAGRDRYNQTKRIKQSYLLRADYFTATGDGRQAKVYNDSLIGVYRLEEGRHTSQYIARASQRFAGEKIADRETKLRTTRTRLALISLAALLFLAAAGVILSLYRRKNAAYNALAQRAKEWAYGNTSSVPARDGGTEIREDPPTPRDAEIIALAEREMTDRNAYREPGLTAESLADRLGVHRNHLSRAVNRTTGGNFNRYLNGYRIREAVRIISSTGRGGLYIEELYERVGFSNRTSFYRAFKQFTGLSPIEFQKEQGVPRGGGEI